MKIHTNILAASQHDAEYTVAIVDDATREVIGFVNKITRKDSFSDEKVVKGVYEIEAGAVVFPENMKDSADIIAKRQYSEVLMYDPASPEYPRPSEIITMKDRPTHLEVDELLDEAVAEDIISFRDYVESQYGSEFDPSGLSDDEFYELEDAYRRDIPSEQRELNYR